MDRGNACAGFARAWRISDLALRAERACDKHRGPRHLQRIWRGEALARARVLVRCYHGLGDTLQFIRFAAPLRKIARKVIVWCQPELVPLIGRVAGVDRALPLHDGTPDVDYDVDIEIMELPYALRIAPGTIAGGVPYLFAPPQRPCSEGLHVGIVWEAGDWDPRRSVPLTALCPLTGLPRVHLYSLHPGARWGALPFRDFSAPAIATLASRMAGLDVLVSVDTMAAHLAGALGRPTFTLLHTDCDWRWGRIRRCVWYPTMRLFRQREKGNWTAPMQDVAQALRSLALPRFAAEHRNEYSRRALLP